MKRSLFVRTIPKPSRKEILELYAEGLTTREIATRFQISESWARIRSRSTPVKASRRWITPESELRAKLEESTLHRTPAVFSPSKVKLRSRARLSASQTSTRFP